MNIPRSSSLSSDKPDLDGGGHSMFAAVVEMLDGRLRARHGVHAYSDAKDCVFRIEIAQARHALVLSDLQLNAGERFINLHMWNDHVPPIPPRGPTFGWARQMDRVLSRSLRDLAVYLAQRRDLDDATCICANLGLGTPARRDQIVRVMQRYGFEPVATEARMTLGERMHIAGENILISMFVFACNPKALRVESLRRGRILMATSRKTLARRYGERLSHG